MRRVITWLVVALTAHGTVACGGDPTPAPSVIQENRALGSLVIDRVATPINGCSTGSTADGTFLDLFYGTGALRFSRAQLAAGDTVLTCTKLDRTWQARVRGDHTVYWRGFLDVRCSGPVTVEGRIDVTCGHPTAAELELLDRDQASHAP